MFINQSNGKTERVKNKIEKAEFVADRKGDSLTENIADAFTKRLSKDKRDYLFGNWTY